MGRAIRIRRSSEADDEAAISDNDTWGNLLERALPVVPFPLHNYGESLTDCTA
jgi:hypothetical protein